MFCMNCGERISEDMKFCPKCGAALKPPDRAEYIAPRGFSAKKNIIIILLAALLVLGAVAAVTAFAVTHSPSYMVSHGLTLAERFLSEQNYEQAVIEFLNVIEIEPMNVDAYLGLADAYIELGEIDKAIEILQVGLERTDDRNIRRKLNKLLESEEPDSSEEPPFSGMTETSVPEEPPFSSTPETIEPEDTGEPEYGSKGSVTIAGTQLDVATTTHLFIFNREAYKESGISGGDLYDNPESNPEYTYIFITDTLSHTDLEKIGQLVYLKDLRIAYSGLSDLTPLSSLKRLEKLNLFYNNISDISPIVNLNGLTYLHLGKNRINDISIISNLTNLDYLVIWGNELTDLKALANLSKLENLFISENQISDITPLANLKHLEKVNLGHNQISNISVFANLNQLKELDLRNNQIADISPLSRLTNLESLSLIDNQISVSDQDWLEAQLPGCDISF